VGGTVEGPGALRRRIAQVAARVAAWAGDRGSVEGKSGPRLAPLTAEFIPAQHQVYVDHLNAAIDAPKVRNIALTGRYGAGKSSILEQFAAQPAMGGRVLSLALSTLGSEQIGTPLSAQDAVANSTTNRIEKELVKQLLHREKPSRLRQSRYERIEVLPKARAALDAAGVVAALAVVLWAVGMFPSVPGASGDHPWPVRLIAVVGIGLAPIALVAWVRLAVHNRFSITQVSAAGASISLTRTGSYFDEYLDEILYFFERTTEVDVVLFEDLDRFDDPGIFEALRELNTLLNNTKQVGDRTIRFVYALRDSVFEKLGRDRADGLDDAAHAEATRANRTKFFDLVIPIVPFITHRNARDLLTRILQDDQHGAVVPVSPELVDLTARHIPDMRLLRNIRNEYSVFARRLITEQQGMESLQANQLFALIVYKNIHLADFEDMLLGRSKLDELYRLYRQLVTEAMGARRARLRELALDVALPQALATKAERWGNQLSWFVEEVRKAKSVGRGNLSLTGYEVAGNAYSADQVISAEFWRAARTSGVGLAAQFDRAGTTESFQVDPSGLDRLLLDELPPEGWDKAERSDLDRQRAQIESEIEILRTADFVELAEHPEFTISMQDEQLSFSDLLAVTIESELGRALISSGYVDRYYTLYIAQYYGDHVPPNAMNYIRQNVDTNRADVNYPLVDDEIAAVLHETKGVFLSERSAYNVAILDYLFVHDEARARVVLDVATRQIGDDEQVFLDAYFVDGTSKYAAANYLASGWPRTFVYLVTEAALAVDAKLELVSAALAGGSPHVAYEFNDEVRGYLQSNYQSLPVLTRQSAMDNGVEQAIDEEHVRNAVSALVRAGVVFGELSELSPEAIARVVEHDSYALTKANLRTILGEEASLSLDSIAAINRHVYEDCLQRPDEYLAAHSANAVLADPAPGRPFDAASESGSDWTIERPSAFAGVVADLVTHTGGVPIAVLTLAHPDCLVADLGDVPTEAWPALAETRRIGPTLLNADRYIQEVGEVDAKLAATLVPVGRIIDVPGDDGDEGGATAGGSAREAKSRVASAILRAREVIPDSATRVDLAASLGLGDWFALADVEPEEGQLLGHLVSADIWNDEAALIGHFSTAGWGTLCFAIQQSATFIEYMTPTLLAPSMATELLNSSDINEDLKQAVLKRFDEFVDTASGDGLSAAGKAALATGTLLTVANIVSIASGTSNPDLVVRLLDAHAKSIAAGEIVNALAHLPSPYNQLAQSGARLKFPRDEHHEAVLKRVHAAGLIVARSQKGSILKPPRVDVTVK